ncbi:MAG: PAS domain-containing sensor histidine kinase [Nitrospinaceae bacterium]|nr:MAG: PAS domain-containing sensor histidine kinase [Nitrospinaceae bacterium]
MPHIRESPDPELKQRLKTVMVLRIVFLTGFVVFLLLLGARIEFSASLVPLTAIICSGYFLTIIYALFFNVCKPSFAASFQVVGDLFLVAGIIYTTGGTESPLSFLFLFVIIVASFVLSRAACYFAASGASILYGLLIDLEYYRFIQPYYLFHEPDRVIDGSYAFYLVFLNIGSYYCVAYLSSFLNQRLRIVKEELAAASKDLEELQVFHTHVVRDMGTGLITTDESGVITSLNRAAEDITGYKLEESWGLACDALLPFPILQDYLKFPNGVSQPVQTEGECKRKDGKAIFIRMKVSRFSNLESPRQGFICVFEDLTDYKEMREKISQAEQLAAVGRFSAGLAHEIRNPLASLSGSIQMLSKGLQLENTHRRLMEIVIKETDRLNGILTDFLNYSHPRKNRQTLVDLTQLIQDVILLIKNSKEFSPAHHIEIAPGAGHLVISADEQELKQLVWNLCINGLQSMSSGGTLKLGLSKVASFQTRTFQSDKRGFVFTIEDEGCGIAADQLKKIFDPFHTTKDNGVGLGLATVYRIVQQMGGTLDVASQEGKGTRFSVFLPRGAADAGKNLEDLELDAVFAARTK